MLAAMVEVPSHLSVPAPVWLAPRAYWLLDAETSRNKVSSDFSKSLYN